MIGAAETIKLNLGCRGKSIPGFLGLDCNEHPGVDFVGDAADLSRFADGSISEIYASHILEHFPHPRTLAVLREWCRVLAHGGILYVAVPDFARAVELYRVRGLEDWVQNLLCGDQEYETAHHYSIFDFPRLRGLLLEAGFSEASRVENFPIGDDEDCSRKVSNHDGKPVSLNVLGVK